MSKAGTKTYKERKLLRVFLESLAAIFVLAGCIWGVYMLKTGLEQSGAPELIATESAPVPTSAPAEAPTEPPTEPPSEPPTEAPTAPPPKISQEQVMLDAMSLEEKICQLFMVAPEALTEGGTVTTAPQDLEAALAQYPVGGIILFGDNLVDRDQCIALINAFQEASVTPLLIGVDEEGGIVSRLGAKEALGVTHFDPMGKIGATGEDMQAYTVGLTLGQELLMLGFNVDFAPVADVNSNPKNPVIGNRSFGSDPELVARMVASCVSGFQDAGLISCIKHFPGHGDTTEDSHNAPVVLNKNQEELWETELFPFVRGIEAGTPMVMVGHIALPKITGDSTPASLSSAIVTDLLRNELYYGAVVVTDAMNMGAITKNYSAGEATVMALQAGCDLILMPEDLQAAVEAVKKAVAEGILTEERINISVMRILEMKLTYGVCPSN